MTTPVGRYAPSPTGDLHVGNLRTALLAWLSANAAGGELRLRIDDLDPITAGTDHESRQRRDLAALGITFSGPELRQSERTPAYRDAIRTLEQLDLVYPCFCSRREIREAASAPHVHLPEGAYPGTCRSLTVEERRVRGEDRPAAMRVRTGGPSLTFIDGVHGEQSETVDDFVVRRNDGVPAYNLATVVDDEDHGVSEVVRGADLLVGTPRHIWLRDALGLRQVEHAHVPLIINANGDRLAKRDGGVTLRELQSSGVGADEVRAHLARSVGLASAGERPTMEELRDRYDPDLIPRHDTVWEPLHAADPTDSTGQKNNSDTV